MFYFHNAMVRTTEDAFLRSSRLSLCLTVMSSDISLFYSRDSLVISDILPSFPSKHPYCNGALICVSKKQRFMECVNHGK
jgi:hypothetical protein